MDYQSIVHARNDEREEGDDESWAQNEGVPSMDEPFVQKYLDGRDALISQENRQRSDHSFRQTLSPMASEACSIVADIRTEERQTLWNRDFEDSLAQLGQVDVFPGMMFSLAKRRMESSKLWKIIRKMPKGALLHCHIAAMGNYDLLIDQALETENLCISAEAPLCSNEALEKVSFSFRHSSKARGTKLEPPWSASYKVNQLVPLAVAADSFPVSGREGFKNWLKTRITISEEHSLQHHLGPKQVWDKMRSCFPIVGSLIFYEPLFRKFVWCMLSQLNEDGVRWVDIRADFVLPFQSEGSDEPDKGFENCMRVLQETIDSFKTSDEGKGFWGARLIWTGIRIFDTRTIVEDMKECIRMKQLFPDLICGYDFVGEEDAGRSLADLISEIFWFKKRCVEEGVDIPFFFHAGETLGSGDEVDENLFDAILLGTRRIGHGFALYKHPLLIDMVKEKKIHIESCPISNEVLRLTGSVMSNPLPALLARGVSCSLCNDDPAILGQGTSGMTHDFCNVLLGIESVGLEGLASMAESSVRYAAFEDCTAKEWQKEVKDGAFGSGVRAERMKHWQRDWEQFCQWIVMEYGAEQDINKLLYNGETEAVEERVGR